MSDKRPLLEELKRLISSASEQSSSNIASSVNVGKGKQHSSISSKQRVVQKDGITTEVTETREERRTDD